MNAPSNSSSGEPAGARRGRMLAILVPLAAIAGVAVIFLFDPLAAEFFPECVLYKLTGMYCPGCGATRALHALSHGSFRQAFAWNPLLVLALPAVLLYAASEFKRIATGQPMIEKRAPAWSIYLLFVVVMLYWILRNIPAAPFHLLAPHAL